MAPPKSTHASPKWKQLKVIPYLIEQVSLGADTQLAVFFIASQMDKGAEYVCPYGFLEDKGELFNRYVNMKMSGAQNSTLQKLPYSVQRLAGAKPGGGYVLYSSLVSVATPIGVDELTGAHGARAEGTFKLIHQGPPRFVTRVHMQLSRPHVREFDLSFEGSTLSALAKPSFDGLYFPISTTASTFFTGSGRQPRDEAEKAIDQFLAAAPPVPTRFLVQPGSGATFVVPKSN